MSHRQVRVEKCGHNPCGLVCVRVCMCELSFFCFSCLRALKRWEENREDELEFVFSLSVFSPRWFGSFFLFLGGRRSSSFPYGAADATGV